jgi:hypothetical protein
MKIAHCCLPVRSTAKLSIAEYRQINAAGAFRDRRVELIA